MKIKKKNWLGRVWGGGGGQSGCVRRIEDFVKIHKKKMGWGREGEGSGLGGQGGCELKRFWENSQKKNFRGGSVWGGGGSGWL